MSVDDGREQQSMCAWPTLPSVPVLSQNNGTVSVLHPDGRKGAVPSPSSVIPDGWGGCLRCGKLLILNQIREQPPGDTIIRGKI